MMMMMMMMMMVMMMMTVMIVTNDDDNDSDTDSHLLGCLPGRGGKGENRKLTIRAVADATSWGRILLSDTNRIPEIGKVLWGGVLSE